MHSCKLLDIFVKWKWGAGYRGELNPRLLTWADSALQSSYDRPPALTTLLQSEACTAVEGWGGAKIVGKNTTQSRTSTSAWQRDRVGCWSFDWNGGLLSFNWISGLLGCCSFNWISGLLGCCSFHWISGLLGCCSFNWINRLLAIKKCPWSTYGT